jgi:CRP/FNR family transcriptional regulator, cyclic AMP receptor protein
VTFFDYPGTEDGRESAPAEEVFLPDASDGDWAVLLRHCRRRRFDTGQTVIEAGAPSRSLYLVVDGLLEVLAPVPGRRANRFRRIVTVGAGSVLGEMSFFDSAGRSAMVRAVMPVVVDELTPADFDALADEDAGLGRQILFDLGRILAQRLRKAQSPPWSSD